MYLIIMYLAFRSNTPEETTFHLLHLSLMREYLDFEFASVKVSVLNIPYFYQYFICVCRSVIKYFIVCSEVSSLVKQFEKEFPMSYIRY